MVMEKPPRRFTDEILSDEMAAILRAKTGAERLEIAFGMWRFARQMIEATARAEHPEWTERELQQHVAWRMSHGAVGASQSG
jgi:Rv0078B-related antitoxin